MAKLSVQPVAQDDLTPELAEALRPRIERLGYLGEFFTCAAHQPGALLAFISFTEELKHALPARITELVALTVATSFANDYERHQHERLSVKIGLGRSWVQDVERLDPAGAADLTDEDRQVQALVLQVLERQGRVEPADVRHVVDAVGEPVAVGILMLTARYAAHALMSNAFGVTPPVPSIFDEELSDDG